jgi:hypothetical protein
MADNALVRLCCANEPDPAKVEALFLTADTQDDGWRWELRVLDVDSNRQQVAYGNAVRLLADGSETDADCLGAVMDRGWNGIPVTMALIDEGGHRKDEVMDFVRSRDRVFSYKGGWQGGFDSGEAWKLSANQEKLILARRPDFQDRLLWYLFFAPTGGGNNEWRLLPEDRLTESYITELGAFRPNPRKKDGDARKNWDHGGRKHDWFDVGMMYLVLEDVAIKLLDPSEFRLNEAEVLRRSDIAPEQEAKPESHSTGWVKSW